MDNKVSGLTENDIRPDQLMAGQREALQHDIAFLEQHKDRFVSVSCPACTSSDSFPKYEKNGIGYSECRECGTVYVNPRPPSDLLEEFYLQSRNYAYWSKYIFPQSEDGKIMINSLSRCAKA